MSHSPDPPRPASEERGLPEDGRVDTADGRARRAWSNARVSRPTLTALVLALAVEGLIAGCGGEPARAPEEHAATTPVAITVDEPAGTATVTDPARAAYIRRADRICSTLDPRRETKLQEVDAASDPAGAYEATVTLAREQLRRIEALTPPAADADLIAQNVIDRLRTRLVVRGRLEHDLATGDEAAAARDQAEYEALGIAVRSFARGYGFAVCGTR